MDLLTLLGLLLAVSAITVGAILKGAGAAALVSLAALMIVLVGTVAAICVQTPLPTLRRALGMLPWVLRPPGVAGEAVIERIVGSRALGPRSFRSRNTRTGRASTWPGPNERAQGSDAAGARQGNIVAAQQKRTDCGPRSGCVIAPQHPPRCPWTRPSS